MAEPGDDKTPKAERIASGADRRREAWGATFDDMTAMADELEDEGWETVRTPVGDSGPFGPSSGRGGEGAFGFAYVILGDKTETVADLFEATSFPEYEVYRTENDGRVYIATALFSPETETVVFIAGIWDPREALECATVAVEEERIYFYPRKLDGTAAGVVECDDPKKFFPNLDAIRRYALNSGGEGEGDENRAENRSASAPCAHHLSSDPRERRRAPVSETKAFAEYIKRGEESGCMKVADAMTHGEEVVMVSLPGTRNDVLEYLQERGFPSVPVVKETDEGMKYRGFISWGNLIEHPDEDQLAMLVREVPTASADGDLETVAAAVVSKDTRRIPVVDDDAIEGILTVTDVVWAIARGDIDGETEVGDVAVRDMNTMYVDVPPHIVERGIFYANVPYAVILDDEASLAGIVTGVGIIKVARVVEDEADTSDSVANQGDEWTWKGIKAVGDRYIPTRNAEVSAESVSKFMTDDLVSIATRAITRDAAQMMIREDIEQIPLVSGDELIGVVRDISLLEALYE